MHARETRFSWSFAAALLVTAGLVASRAGAQGAGDGFLLSRRVDLSTNERAFTRSDTLYMSVWSDRIDVHKLRSAAWQLQDASGKRVRLNLAPSGTGGFRASFKLSGLPTSSTIWTWSARLEDRTGNVYAPFAQITVGPAVAPPLVDFGAAPQVGTAPLQVSFTDQSTGGATSWLWDFGDGTSSTLRHPSHVYVSPGTFTVRLTASNTGGAGSRTKVAWIDARMAPPVADFGAAPQVGTAPLEVSFTDQSTGGATSWLWDFGDGASSTLQHPSHVYVSPGTFTVQLGASNAGGTGSRTMESWIEVSAPVAPPEVAFGAAPLAGSAPLEVSFTDQSTGVATSWLWDFGDGTSSSLQHPSHVYLTPGTFTVQLSAGNAIGTGSGAMEGWIEVSALPPPEVAFAAAPLAGSAPLEVSFTDQSTGGATSWLWDFGDGTSSGLQHPSHVYLSPGTFTVQLGAGNAGGTGSLARADWIEVRTPEPAIRYGMNLSVNRWSERSIAFADAMARASEFCRVVSGRITSTLAPVVPLGQDPPRLGAGWPDLAALAAGEAAGARLFGSMNGSMPDGRVQPYIVTWEGTGSCRLSGSPVLAEVNRSAHRVEVFVDPGVGGDAQLIWIVDSSSPADPVRDAHVWLPGMEATRPLLWAPFVEKLQAMNAGQGPHTLRTMDWSGVNYYGRKDGTAPFVFDLAGGIRPASPSQGTLRGVCPEFQVALCNAVGANMHFNVPHQANSISDADYLTFVRDVLTRIRDGSPAVPGINGERAFAGLDPALTLTIEFSNECWNPGFPVNAWVRARALARGVTTPQQVAAEVARISAVAREVFAGPDAARLRVFVGGWNAEPSFLANILDALPGEVRVDQVGPSGYFAPLASDVAFWLAGASPGNCPNCPTPLQILASARRTIPALRLRIRAQRSIADSFRNTDGSSPELVIYEAGQSFVANFQPWGAAANLAQVLPEMFDAYVLDLVPMLVDEGVDEVRWYSFMASNSVQGNAAGPFGAWDNMNQSITLPVPEPYVDEGAPKAAAIYKGPPPRTP